MAFEIGSGDLTTFWAGPRGWQLQATPLSISLSSTTTRLPPPGRGAALLVCVMKSCVLITSLGKTTHATTYLPLQIINVGLHGNAVRFGCDWERTIYVR